MRKLHLMQTLQELAKALNKPCMFISLVNIENYDEVSKAAPYLSFIDDSQLFIDEIGFIVFDTEKEMNKAFNETVGDSGPTTTNKYNGNTRVYAITCNAKGELLTENA